MDVTETSVEIISYLLGCSRFKGSHTGERICEAFELLCDEYGCRHKVDYVICDNAANMKKAFSTCFSNDENEMDSYEESHLLTMMRYGKT